MGRTRAPLKPRSSGMQQRSSGSRFRGVAPRIAARLPALVGSGVDCERMTTFKALTDH